MSLSKSRQLLALFVVVSAVFGLLGVLFLVQGMRVVGEWLFDCAMIVGALGAVTFFVLGMQTQSGSPTKKDADIEL